MDYEEFIGRVQQQGRMESIEDATNAIRATFETLAERITADESGDLASQLPEEVADYLFREPDDPIQRFSVPEFFARIAQRTGLSTDQAAARARAVFQVLGEAVVRGELDDMRAQLPRDFHPLLQPGETRARSAQ